MKRFIRYLYEYQQGQRIRNVGFVKVEQDEEETTVHIHGKGLRLSGDKCLKLYIFFKDGDGCTGIWQGNIENVNPAVNYKLCYNTGDTGRPEYYPLIEGIVMENDNQRKFAAVWNDMPADLENMKIWQEKEKEPSDEHPPEEESLETSEDMAEIEESDRETAGEAPDIPECEEVPEKVDEEDRYIEPAWPQYTKIQRQDIARLPRCEWRLANNSFLLHGYYNYHHLLFIEDGDASFIGVPGIYHPREAKAAEAFGFSKFIRVDEDALGLSRDEKNCQEDFGYWCRQVRR